MNVDVEQLVVDGKGVVICEKDTDLLHKAADAGLQIFATADFSQYSFKRIRAEEANAETVKRLRAANN